MKEWKLSQNMFGEDYELSTVKDRQVLAYIQPTCGFDDVKNLIENVPQMRDLIDLGYTLINLIKAIEHEETISLETGIKKYQSQYEKLLDRLEGDKD